MSLDNGRVTRVPPQAKGSWMSTLGPSRAVGLSSRSEPAMIDAIHGVRCCTIVLY